MKEAKEKAKELIEKFEGKLSYGCTHNCKQCALICVDEIIKDVLRQEYFPNDIQPMIRFWQQVKEHLNKL